MITKGTRSAQNVLATRIAWANSVLDQHGYGAYTFVDANGYTQYVITDLDGFSFVTEYALTFNRAVTRLADACQ